MIDEKLIRQSLQAVLHPKLNKSLIDIGMIRNISINDDVVTLTLALKSDHSPLKKVFINEIEKAEIPKSRPKHSLAHCSAT